MGRRWMIAVAILLTSSLGFALHCGRKGSQDADMLQQRGKALIRMGMAEEALALLGSAIEIEPGRYDILETYWELRFKRDEGAEDELERLEQESPGNPLYPRLLSVLLRDPSQRMEAGRRALKMIPDEPEVFLSLGDAFSALGAADSAESYYTKALNLDPAMSAASLAMAKSKADRGEKVGAVAIYRSLFHLGPDIEGYDEAVRELFELLWDKAEPAEAIAVARTRVSDPWVQNDIAWKMADAGVELALAESLALEAIDRMQAGWIETDIPEIDEEWAESTAKRYRGYFYDTLGHVHLRAGESEKAVDALEMATSSIPYVDSEVQIKLAKAYSDLGRLDEAIDALLDVVAISLNAEAMAQLEATYVEKKGDRTGLEELVSERRRNAVRPSTDFRMNSLTEEEVSLSDFRGKVVLLNFWFPT